MDGGRVAAVVAVVLVLSVMWVPAAVAAQESAGGAVNASDGSPGNESSEAGAVERALSEGRSWVDAVREWWRSSREEEPQVVAENRNLGDGVTVERIEWYEGRAVVHIHAEEETEIGAVDLVDMQEEGWSVAVYEVPEGESELELYLETDNRYMAVSLQERGVMGGYSFESPDKPFLHEWTWRETVGGVVGAVLTVVGMVYVYAYDRKRKYNKEWRRS